MWTKAIFILLCLCVISSNAATIEEFVSSMPTPLEEVDKAIVKDFARQQSFGTKDVKELMQDFSKFKKQWTERMIEFLIRELEINEEGAREARKNPDSFYINYETYKIFVNSIWFNLVLFLFHLAYSALFYFYYTRLTNYDLWILYII